ncbi:hypothetical protein ANN_23713 [Periplaneta americana]|uniref:Uncharacterized protein n=1 Tax=Periplaneta americana TaxID=6978 RepID=A0ABQ8SN66_PERAM|nr:hypothetical protein ANN_23713 [Periplaneta americana]
MDRSMWEYSMRHRPQSGRQQLYEADVEENVLGTIDQYPAVSTVQICVTLGISHAAVWRNLRSQKLHLFRLQKVQELTPAEFSHCLNCCQWLLQRHANDPMFIHRYSLTMSHIYPSKIFAVEL